MQTKYVPDLKALPYQKPENSSFQQLSKSLGLIKLPGPINWYVLYKQWFLHTLVYLYS